MIPNHLNNNFNGQEVTSLYCHPHHDSGLYVFHPSQNDLAVIRMSQLLFSVCLFRNRFKSDQLVSLQASEAFSAPCVLHLKAEWNMNWCLVWHFSGLCLVGEYLWRSRQSISWLHGGSHPPHIRCRGARPCCLTFNMFKHFVWQPLSQSRHRTAAPSSDCFNTCSGTLLTENTMSGLQTT